jgi:hypothetical protein
MSAEPVVLSALKAALCFDVEETCGQSAPTTPKLSAEATKVLLDSAVLVSEQDPTSSFSRRDSLGWPFP